MCRPFSNCVSIKVFTQFFASSTSINFPGITNTLASLCCLINLVTSTELTKEVLKNKKNVGILICGTGVGMSIAANRKKGIRAGLANNSKIARLIRKHNDANILVLPGRFINTSEAKKSVQAFLSTKFESGRHKRRIKKL